MRNIFSILVGVIICFMVSLPIMADELKVNIGVESGERATQVVGADIYALVDGKLTEITVAPDDMAFRMNGKFGALRLKSFWLTNAKLNKVSDTNQEVK